MPGPSSGAIPKQLQPPPSSSQPVQRPSAPPHIRKLPPVINQLASGPRLQAFAVSSSPASGFNQIPQQLPAANKTTKQLETRQRQLEMLRRMEERYKNMAPVQRPPAAAGQPSPPQPIPQRPPDDPHLPPQGDHNQQVWPLIPFFLFAFTVVENSQKKPTIVKRKMLSCVSFCYVHHLGFGPLKAGLFPTIFRQSRHSD